MDARRDARGELPRVVGVYCPPAAEGSAEEPITLIIGGSRQFGINFLVTVYYEERLVPVKGPIFERAIGMGQVVNVQENGLIQVLMLREVSNHAELWQRIRERDTAVLAGVVVKPSIDFNSIGIEVRFDERG